MFHYNYLYHVLEINLILSYLNIFHSYVKVTSLTVTNKPYIMVLNQNNLSRVVYNKGPFLDHSLIAYMNDIFNVFTYLYNILQADNNCIFL